MGLIKKSVRWRAFYSASLAIASTLGWRGANLDPNHLLKVASKKTGLDDFGSGNFLEPMQHLIQDFLHHNHPDTLGKVILKQLLSSCLEKRLYLTQILKTNPAINNVPISAPLFVIGLPRTGTTFLQGLLSQVESFRPLLNWETHQLPVPLCQATPQQIQFQIKKAQGEYDGLIKLVPDILSAHELGASEPEECNPFLMSSFHTMFFAIFFYPKTYEEYLAKLKTNDSFQWHKKHLQALSFNLPEKIWSLKSPIHLQTLGPLLDTYPDARIIFTHRTPLECIPSMISLKSMLSMLCLPRQEDPSIMGERTTEFILQMVESGYKVRDEWPSHAKPFLDVTYKNLVQNPIETVRRILVHFDIPVPNNLDEKLQDYLAKKKQHRFGAHKYSLADFNLKESDIRKKFEREFSLAGD